MTTLVDPLVPAALRDVLDSDDLAAHEGFTILLMTVRDDGWPHLAMISVGEIVAVDDGRLRLALWARSTSAANLAQRGAVTLATVVAPASYLVRATARPLGEIATTPAHRLHAFEATVCEVAVDEAPYAVLEAGVRFRLKDPTSTMARWAELRRALRELPA